VKERRFPTWGSGGGIWVGGAPVAGLFFLFFFSDNKSERRVRSSVLLTLVFLV
jgi:hypothetical protein